MAAKRVTNSSINHNKFATVFHLLFILTQFYSYGSLDLIIYGEKEKIEEKMYHIYTARAYNNNKKKNNKT